MRNDRSANASRQRALPSLPYRCALPSLLLRNPLF
jgi:hypothetical protein